MSDHTVSKSRYKAHALEYFREVERTGRELVVTDRGEPVIRIVPYRADPARALQSLRESVVRYGAPLDPVGEDEIDFLPVDPWIAARSVSLAGFPRRDPADRMIAATALAHRATLVTADGRLQGYDSLTTLWD